MDRFIAGAGKAEIELSGILTPNQENFTWILDPLYVRVVVIKGTSQAAFVSLELTSLMSGTEEIKNIVEEITGTDRKLIWVTVSHTFSAPHIHTPQVMPEGRSGGPRWSESDSLRLDALMNAVRKAAKQAHSSMRPVKVGCGVGFCDVNSGRDVKTAEGWWLGEGSMEFADKTLLVFKMEDSDGNPVAVLYNYAVQSSVLDHAAMPGGGYPVSGDLCGRVSSAVEYACPGTVALFLCGAAGDQAPRLKASTYVINKNGVPELVERGYDGIGIMHALGDNMAKSLLQTLEKIHTGEPEDTSVQIKRISFEVPAKKMEDRNAMGPKKQHEYIPDGTENLEIELLRIGNSAFVGLKPELSASVGKVIRDESPFSFTAVVTMVNGGAKYLADSLAFKRYTYAARNSFFADGAAEVLAVKAAMALKELAE